MSERVIKTRLVELREEKRLNQSQVASIIGVNKSTYLRMEQGKVKSLKEEYLEKLAILYGVLPGYITGVTDLKEPDEAKEAVLQSIRSIVAGMSVHELKKVEEAAKNVILERHKAQ